MMVAGVAGMVFITGPSGTSQFTSFVQGMLGGGAGVALLAALVITTLQGGGMIGTALIRVAKLRSDVILHWVVPILIVLGSIVVTVWGGNVWGFVCSRLLIGSGSFLALLAVDYISTQTVEGEERAEVTSKLQLWVVTWLPIFTLVAFVFLNFLPKLAVVVVLGGHGALAILLWVVTRNLPRAVPVTPQQGAAKPKLEWRARLFADVLAWILEMGGGNAVFFFGVALLGSAFPNSIYTGLLLAEINLIINWVSTRFYMSRGVASTPRKRTLLSSSLMMAGFMLFAIAGLLLPPALFWFKILLVGVGLGVFTWSRAKFATIVFTMWGEFFRTEETRQRGVAEATLANAFGGLCVSLLSAWLIKTPVLLFCILEAVLVIGVFYAVIVPETYREESN